MRKAPILLFPTLVVAFLCGAYSHAQPTLPVVKAVRVGGSGTQAVISGMGSITCPRSLELGFDDVGLIAEIYVEEGDSVKRGQPVARLENSMLLAEKGTTEARLKAALADVRYCQNELNKKERLFDKQAVSDTDLQKAALELEKAQAAMDLARAELNMADTKLKKKILYAPISGVVAKRYVDTGSVITPGANRVISLVRCQVSYANIELGERLYSLVQPGRGVAVSVDALGGMTFHGLVSRIGPQIDKKNRTFNVVVKIDNRDLRLHPGMFARAQIDVQEEHSALSIPKKALLTNGSSRNAIYVVKDGVAARRDITLGEALQEKVRVVNGLEKGDLVVVEGQKRVSDLAEVSVELLEEK